MRYILVIMGVVLPSLTVQARVLDIHDQRDYDSISPQAIIMVTTPTCGPCQLVKPHFKSLSEQYSNITFYITESSFIRNTFNIRGFPTFLFLQNGTEVDRLLTGEQNFIEKFTQKLHNAFGITSTQTTVPRTQSHSSKRRNRRRKKRCCS